MPYQTLPPYDRNAIKATILERVRKGATVAAVCREDLSFEMR